MTKRVAVIGAKGYVGRAYADLLRKKFDVIDVDPLLGSMEMQKENVMGMKIDLAVVAVPTPQSPNGAADLSILFDTIQWLTSGKRKPLILIKSTIPPGTTMTLRHKFGRRIVFSPEYIGEGGYTIPWWRGEPHPTDPSLHNFAIFGGERKYAIEVAQFFKPIMGPQARFYYTDSTTAELTKYMENAFFGLKVSFCNEFYEIAKAFGVDYDELRELWLLDERNTRGHTHVFPDKRGFGGKCLPKDINAIAYASEKAGWNPKLIKALLKFNEEITAKPVKTPDKKLK
jgi:UDPglucose 6-dehydrogenase